MLMFSEIEERALNENFDYIIILCIVLVFHE